MPQFLVVYVIVTSPTIPQNAPASAKTKIERGNEPPNIEANKQPKKAPKSAGVPIMTKRTPQKGNSVSFVMLIEPHSMQNHKQLWQNLLLENQLRRNNLRYGLTKIW